MTLARYMVIGWAIAITMLTGRSANAQAVTRDEVFVQGNTLESIRRIVLRDTSRINFCAVDAFWDPISGASKLMNPTSISTQRNRKACPSPQNRGDQPKDEVVIHSVTPYADSIVMRGSTVRGERTLFVESYMLPRPIGRGGLEYRVTLIRQVD